MRSPSAAPTPAERGTFLRWLRRSHPALSAHDVREGLARLAQGGVLDAPGDVAATELARTLGAEEAESLLLLQSAWSAWRVEEGIPWVGETRSAGDDDVEWVTTDSPAPADVPRGPAPHLTPPGRARPPRLPDEPRWRPRDLVVPILLLASLATLGALAEHERRALTDERAETGRVLAELALDDLARRRVVTEAQVQALAGLAARAREAQLDAMLARCEGGAWCDERRVELEAAVVSADSLVAAVGLPAPGAELQPGSGGLPPRVLGGEAAALRAQAADLARAAGAAAADDSPGAAVERQRLERRRKVLLAEAAALSDPAAGAVP